MDVGKVGRVGGLGRDKGEEENINNDLCVGHGRIELVELENGQVGEQVVLTVLDLHVKVVFEQGDIVGVVSVYVRFESKEGYVSHR